MKIKFSGHILFVIVVALALGIGIPACNKTSNSPGGVTPGTSTVTAVIKNASDATKFLGLLTRVHLDTVLSGTGPFTVFVPTDAAFAASGVTDAVLTALPDSTIKSLLLYHTLAGVGLFTANFPAGPNGKLITASGDSIFVTTNSTGVFVNGIPALNVDIVASNGLIDAMSGVLIPPKGNIVQTIQSDTAFSYLAAAIARASQGSTNISNTLSGGGPYTLLAPVNNGFRAAGFATTADINSANPDTLADMLLYHVVPSRIFTSDIINNQTRPTLTDSSIVFNVSGSSLLVLGKGNGTPINIIGANIMARNGVVFIIDQLLKKQ